MLPEKLSETLKINLTEGSTCMNDNIDKTIIDNEKTIKQIEKQLRSMDKLRIEAGLTPGACAAFITQVPISNENLKAAYGRVEQINNDSTPNEMTPHQSNDKQKRKSKLAKKMSKRLRI